MKINNKKMLHIAVIIIGTIFILLAAFHTNIWFDESYSVAIAKHDFMDIWEIDSYDVHPVFYYWMLKVLNMIFGNNILIYRLFSVISVVILGILGYTHIRKDFGEKTGLIFSFLTFFLPINLVYSTEIRMYTWAMLFVSIMAIYAYRIFNRNSSIKNWIIFAIFSLISAYTHYYGLIIAGIINLALFIYIIRKFIREKKENKLSKDTKSDLIKFLVSGVSQIILYIPWLFSFINQITQVSNGFWIRVDMKTIFEIFEFQFTGNLLENIYVSPYIAVLLGIVILIYIFSIIRKIKKEGNIKELKPAILAIIMYLGVILVTAIFSIKTPVLYARYLLNITGLFMFFLAFIMAKGNKKINIIICIAIIVISTYININLIKTNYNPINKEPIKLVKENIKEGDIIIYGNKGSGFIIAANFPENKQYFYDQAKWNVEKAYRAYGPNMETIYDLEELKEYKGRIWIIGAENYAILKEEIPKIFEKEKIEVLKKESFSTAYKSYQYAISLIDVK